MSWSLPKADFASNYLLDVEEYNDNLGNIVAELGGNLNEHNYVDLALDGIMQAAKAEQDVGIQIYSQKQKEDPHNALLSSFFEVPQSESWVPVDDTEISWVSRGGKVFVVFSFQCRMDIPALPSFQSGLIFCAEVDGVLLMGSLLGTGDQGNDFLDAGANVNLGAGQPLYNYASSPSFRANQTPHVVQAVFVVSPGPHVVRLLARNLFTVAAVSQYISQRETVLVDGWA